MRRPILFRLYYGLVLAAAAALVALAWNARPEPPWPIVCAGLALIVIAEAAPVRLPGGGQMTAGTMVDLPLLLVIGAFAAAGAYTKLGGKIGEVEFPEGALALAACGVSFFVVNSLCVSVAIG